MLVLVVVEYGFDGWLLCVLVLVDDIIEEL